MHAPAGASGSRDDEGVLRLAAGSIGGDADVGTITDEECTWSRERNEQVGLAGGRWVEQKAGEFERLPTGTVVIIDIETGEYVTGTTAIEAMDLYDLKIGADRAGFIHRVRRPTFIGGGLAQG